MYNPPIVAIFSNFEWPVWCMRVLAKRSVTSNTRSRRGRGSHRNGKTVILFLLDRVTKKNVRAYFSFSTNHYLSVIFFWPRIINGPPNMQAFVLLTDTVCCAGGARRKQPFRLVATQVHATTIHCVSKNHVTTFSMISWTRTVCLQRFLAHLLLLRLEAIDRYF